MFEKLKKREAAKESPSEEKKRRQPSPKTGDTASTQLIPLWAQASMAQAVPAHLLPPSAAGSTTQRKEGESTETQTQHLLKPNTTGLPDNVKSGVEALSGIALDDVRVHYNSEKPAQIGALAQTQGAEIHIAPGQEKHIAHEAWHVVQQKQGRVRPTVQAKGSVINDEAALEREADAMGDAALHTGPAPVAQVRTPEILPARSEAVQGFFQVDNIDYDPKSQVHHHERYNTPAKQDTITAQIAGTQFWQTLSTAEKGRFNALLTSVLPADLVAAADIPSLANAIIARITNNNGGRIGAITPHADNLINVLVVAASTEHASEKETQIFRGLLDKPGVVASRAKGTPNVIPFASLDANMQGFVNAIHGKLATVHTDLNTLANYINGNWVQVGSRAGETFTDEIREPHQNGSGWLPTNVAVASPEAALDVATQGVVATYRTHRRNDVRLAALAAYPAIPPALTAEQFEDAR